MSIPTDHASFETLEPRRLLAAGDLNPTFGTRGVKVLDGSAGDIVFQPNGKFLLITAGDADNEILIPDTVAVRRFNPDGSPDDTFAGDGTLDLPFGVAGMAIDSAGRIILGGSSEGKWAIARYHADGSPDISFGNNGQVVTAIGGEQQPLNWVSHLALGPGGKIILAGDQDTGNRDETAPWIEHEIAVARFNPDGTPDTTFDRDGELDLQPFDTFVTFAVAPDGRMLIGGFHDAGMDHDANYIELDAAGSRVSSGFEGRISEFIASAYRPDGTFVVGGWSTAQAHATIGRPGQTATQIPIVYNPLKEFGTNDKVYDIAVQNDNKTVLVGHAGENNRGAGLMRLNPDGTPDPTFGFSGSVMLNFKKRMAEWIDEVAIAPDGDILVVGRIGGNPYERFGARRHFIARFQGGVTNPGDDPPQAAAFIDGSRAANSTDPATFTVIYAADQAVDASSLGNHDLLVRGPNQFITKARLVSTAPRFGGRQIVATYSFADDKPWEESHQGNYSVFMRKRQVFDNFGKPVRPGKIGSGQFDVL